MNASHHKIVSVAFSAILILILLGGICQASEATLSAPAELPEGGGSFSVTVSVDSVTNLAGYQVQLQFIQDGYPSTGFILTGSTEGDVFGTQPVSYGNLADGRYSMLSAGSASGTGLLCSLSFDYEVSLVGDFTIYARFLKLGKPDGAVEVRL
ncbi:MAG TPA: cohesin domain-containing protein [Hyphomicrobiaceae bacterium]|nr:cohesin domain-containing protein [Hyphomicrobiaceae bacterium]